MSLVCCAGKMKGFQGFPLVASPVVVQAEVRTYMKEGTHQVVR